MQSPDYLPWAVLCLQLCPIALGMETMLQSDGLPRTATQLIRTFEAGVDAFLFRGTDGVLLLGLSCIFSVQMGDMTFSDIPLYFCLTCSASSRQSAPPTPPGSYLANRPTEPCGTWRDEGLGSSRHVWR